MSNKINNEQSFFLFLLYIFCFVFFFYLLWPFCRVNIPTNAFCIYEFVFTWIEKELISISCVTQPVSKGLYTFFVCLYSSCSSVDSPFFSLLGSLFGREKHEQSVEFIVQTQRVDISFKLLIVIPSWTRTVYLWTEKENHQDSYLPLRLLLLLK